MKTKKKIKELCEQVEVIKSEIDEILRNEIEGFWGSVYVCIPFWDCPTSPVGWCVYNERIDPAHDNCIFCNEPLERN